MWWSRELPYCSQLLNGGTATCIFPGSFYLSIYIFLKCSSCCCSVAKLCVTHHDPMDCSMPGLPVPHYLLEFAQIDVHPSVVPSNRFILCHPLLLLPSIFPSIGVFSNELAPHIRWPRYWSFTYDLESGSDSYFFSTTSYAIKLCNSDFHVEDLCHMILHVTCPYMPLIP